MLLDAPTDAEYATYILRKRSLESKPLRGAKTLRRLSRTARTPSPSPTPTPSLSNISTASTTLDKDIGITSATAGRMPEGLSPVVKKERRLSASSLLSAANALGNRLHSRAPSITDEEVLGSKYHKQQTTFRVLKIHFFVHRSFRTTQSYSWNFNYNSNKSSIRTFS